MNRGLRWLHLPIFWYKESLVFIKRFFLNLLVFLDNKLAVRLMANKILVPLFHDRSFLGRVLSFIFRLVRMVIGGAIIIVVILAMIFWMIVWLLLPFLWIGFLKEVGVISLVGIWLVDSFLAIRRPNKLKGQEVQKKAEGCMKKELYSRVKRANRETENLKRELVKEASVVEILKRIELPLPTLIEMKSLMIYRDWVEKSISEALSLKDDYLEPKHFLLSFLKNEDYRYKEAKQVIDWIKKKKNWATTPFIWSKDYQIRPMGGVDRDWTGIPTPTLNKYSDDLTKKAQMSQLPEILGKKQEVEDLIKILSRKKQNNVLVIGEAGSGKSTLVKGIAQEIVRGITEKSIRFKRLVSIDTSKLAAGADTAELNKRITTIVEEIKAAGNIILFVDEVHNLASINQDLPETSDLFIALEPPLSEGAFQFIGATTNENFKKYIEPNEAFARLFEIVELKEASKNKALEILEFLADELEKSEEVVVTGLALNRMIELSSQFVHDRVLPDSAVNLLDEVVVETKAQGKRIVTSLMVEKLVSKKTKVPVTRLDKEESKKLLNLEVVLHKRVIGQDKAIKAIADAIRRARTELKDPKKPIASFLFAGPTGVGKTETAKTLAEEFFGSEKQMVRLDMSEYQNLDSINRLIGSPPGGFQADEGGQLTESIRYQPYTLLLLDEIEKAHPKILNLFLQVLDDARLTDGRGRLVDFANTIIIATTNVGTRELIAGKNDQAKEVLDEYFPPEFLNRFSGVITYEALEKKQVEKIVLMKLENLKKSLQKQELKIVFSKPVVSELVNLGFSKKWGGRQVDRVIQEKVINVLAKKILKEEIEKNTVIEFGMDWLN